MLKKRLQSKIVAKNGEHVKRDHIYQLSKIMGFNFKKKAFLIAFGTGKSSRFFPKILNYESLDKSGDFQILNKNYNF